MTEEAQSHAYEAEQALSLARQVGGSAAAAARRSVRRHLLLLGAATALAVPASGLISHWDAHPAWVRSVLTAVIWGSLVGAAVWVSGTQPVRALLARGKMITVAVSSGLVVGATMATGYDYPAVYVAGAAVVFAVWALGAWWVGR